MAQSPINNDQLVKMWWAVGKTQSWNTALWLRIWRVIFRGHVLWQIQMV